MAWYFSLSGRRIRLQCKTPAQVGLDGWTELKNRICCSYPNPKNEEYPSTRVPVDLHTLHYKTHFYSFNSIECITLYAVMWKSFKKGIPLAKKHLHQKSDSGLALLVWSFYKTCCLTKKETNSIESNSGCRLAVLTHSCFCLCIIGWMTIKMPAYCLPFFYSLFSDDITYLFIISRSSPAPLQNKYEYMW